MGVETPAQVRVKIVVPPYANLHKAVPDELIPSQIVPSALMNWPEEY
jgi:hypothetical protein